MNRVVITGLGALAPTGLNLEEFWDHSVSGMSAAEYDADFPELDLKSRVVGKVPAFQEDPSGIPKEIKDRLGRPALLALAAALQAVEDADIHFGQLPDCSNKERAGVCIATAIADSPFCEKQFQSLLPFFKNGGWEYHELWDHVDQTFFSKGSFDAVSAEIAKMFDLRGSVFTMSTGCAGGIDAAGYAFQSIRRGEMDVMICGASEAPITGLTMASFDRIEATTVRNAMPKEASAPFDADRDGFVLSEGAGIFLMENLEHARKRGGKIYAEILNYDTCCNASHMTALKQNGEPLAALIRRTLEGAGIRPDEVDYINAHGSSTKQNDVFETEAYKKALGACAGNIPISANKSLMGHPLGAASAIELVRSCLCMKYQMIPPTINLNTPDPACDLDYVPNKKRKKKIRCMISDANGFSGIHSCMVLGSMDAARERGTQICQGE